MIEIWEEFLQFEFANEILMAGGALLVLIGVLKVLRNSLRVIFWVLLVGVGAFSVAYGMDRSSMAFPVSLSQELKDLVGPGREMSVEAMQLLCTRLDILKESN